MAHTCLRVRYGAVRPPKKCACKSELPAAWIYSQVCARSEASRRSRCCVSVCPPASPRPPDSGETVLGLWTIGGAHDSCCYLILPRMQCA